MDASSILVVWQLRVSIPIWILECIYHVYVLASKDRISAHEVLTGMEMGLRVEMGQVQLHLYHNRPFSAWRHVYAEVWLLLRGSYLGAVSPWGKAVRGCNKRQLKALSLLDKQGWPFTRGYSYAEFTSRNGALVGFSPLNVIHLKRVIAPPCWKSPFHFRTHNLCLFWWVDHCIRDSCQSWLDNGAQSDEPQLWW